MMLFQKVSPHSAIFAELILLLLWKFYVWDKIIPLLTVCAAHFFKDRFHDDLLCVFWFRQLLGYFNSFPITAFVITNAPGASTYNVGLLDSHGNAVSDWFEEVPINNPVGFRNLIVGEEYHFVVSSNDVPERGCTANYEVY